MKKILFITAAAALLLASGCASVAQAEETPETDTTIVNATGTVESVNDGDVVISYNKEDSSQTVTESVPDSAIVLKENATMHSDDLQKDDDVTISFANGKMSVIEVLPDSQENDKTEADTQSAATNK
jgi:hypothetical protein